MLQLRRGELLLLLNLEHAPQVRFAGRPLARPDDEIEELRASLNRRGGAFGYITTRLSDTIEVDSDRQERLRTVCATVRAVEHEVVDCYRAFYAADRLNASSDVRAVTGCRVGRYVPSGDIVAIELLFDRLLPRGGSHTFEFSITPRGTGVPELCARRSAGKPTVEFLEMTVCFADPPREVWWSEWTNRRGGASRHAPVPLQGTAAHMAASHPAPGMYGLEWAW